MGRAVTPPKEREPRCRPLLPRPPLPPLPPPEPGVSPGSATGVRSGPRPGAWPMVTRRDWRGVLGCTGPREKDRRLTSARNCAAKAVMSGAGRSTAATAREKAPAVCRFGRIGASPSESEASHAELMNFSRAADSTRSASTERLFLRMSGLFRGSAWGDGEGEAEATVVERIGDGNGIAATGRCGGAGERPGGLRGGGTQGSGGDARGPPGGENRGSNCDGAAAGEPEGGVAMSAGLRNVCTCGSCDAARGGSSVPFGGVDEAITKDEGEDNNKFGVEAEAPGEPGGRIPGVDAMGAHLTAGAPARPKPGIRFGGGEAKGEHRPALVVVGTDSWIGTLAGSTIFGGLRGERERDPEEGIVDDEDDRRGGVVGNIICRRRRRGALSQRLFLAASALVAASASATAPALAATSATDTPPAVATTPPPTATLVVGTGFCGAGSAFCGADSAFCGVDSSQSDTSDCRSSSSKISSELPRSRLTPTASRDSSAGRLLPPKPWPTTPPPESAAEELPALARHGDATSLLALDPGPGAMSGPCAAATSHGPGCFPPVSAATAAASLPGAVTPDCTAMSSSRRRRPGSSPAAFCTASVKRRKTTKRSSVVSVSR
mmetsp:Transcript_85875/g.184052  ORF Transcript_85875/g.184052 Transcript_85875/m.184052 type:complete len:606 (-) Transcript_85875:1024-2841(-)